MRFPGASNHGADRLDGALRTAEAGGWTPCQVVQERHSYLRPMADWDWKLWPAAPDRFLERCKARGLGITAYSPLLAGATTRDDKPLSDAYLWPTAEAQRAALAEVVAETGATANQVGLATLMRSDPRVIPSSRPAAWSRWRRTWGPWRWP